MLAELGFVIGAIMVNVGALWVFIGGVKAHIDSKMTILSQELAEVVMKLTQGVSAAGGEAPNQMQMWLMQLIQSRMQPQRGPNGQFTTQDNENSPLAIEKQNR